MLKKLLHHLRNLTIRFADPVIAPDAATQLQLKVTYGQLVKEGRPLPRLSDVGFRAYSQTDEDGMLLFIFSVIGIQNKKCVEICSGNGIECNSANLILNHGWHGLLVDAQKTLIERGRKFYQKHPSSYVWPPTFVCKWITRNNVNQVLSENGFEGKVDLLSLDMDGVEYWIWNAIEVIDPSVVVVEYQDIIGPEKSLTVPYADDFNAYKYPTTRGVPNFSGASLVAYTKLAKKKGYRLVGCNRYGYNAFFIKQDLAEKEIPEISVDSCFTHPAVIWGMRTRWQTVKDLDWVEV